MKPDGRCFAHVAAAPSPDGDDASIPALLVDGEEEQPAAITAIVTGANANESERTPGVSLFFMSFSKGKVASNDSWSDGRPRPIFDVDASTRHRLVDAPVDDPRRESPHSSETRRDSRRSSKKLAPLHGSCATFAGAMRRPARACSRAGRGTKGPTSSRE